MVTIDIESGCPDYRLRDADRKLQIRNQFSESLCSVRNEREGYTIRKFVRNLLYDQHGSKLEVNSVLLAKSYRPGSFYANGGAKGL
jgi:hypothetical protein